MQTKEQLIEKRQDLAVQLSEAATGVKNAEAIFNQVRGALLAMDALIAELPDPKPEPAPKKGKKGKK